MLASAVSVAETLNAAAAMLGMPEILGVLAIVVVLFGATKLPQLGKGLGEAIGNFKKAQRNSDRDGDHDEIDATPGRSQDRLGEHGDNGKPRA